METLFHDIRFGWRALLRNRGFAFAAVLCLALGIGVNTTVFTVVYSVLLRPLPFADGDRLVTLWGTRNEEQGEGLLFSDIAAYRATGAFSALGAYSGRSFTLTDGETSQRVGGSSITPNIFQIVGVKPQLGRDFVAGDAARAGFEQVVLLSDALWRRSYGGDPAIIGRSVRINDRALTVVGVMPAGFSFPENDEIWLPMGEPENVTARFVWGLGRLADGVSVEEAQSRMDPISSQLAQRDDGHRDFSAEVLTYRNSMVDTAGRTLLWVSFGAVVFVLLIACANVANLLLARGTDRHREVAVRMALGASRARVLRQLLTESILLSLLGGVLGTFIAIWWTDRTVRTIPEQMAYWIRLEVDGGILLFTLGIAVLTGIVFGLLPALQATGENMYVELKEGARSGDSGARTRLRGTLVVAEVALSLVLLVGAALMMQSFLRMQKADAGFDTRPLLSLRVNMAGDRYDEETARARTVQEIRTKLRALPGATGAAVITAIPIDDGGASYPVTTPAAGLPMRDAPDASVIGVTAGAFEAMGLKLDEGRDFRTDEVTDSARHVAIIGRALARSLFPGGNAVGSQILLGDSAVAYSVIGVAPDVQYEEFLENTEESRLQIYVPYAQMAWRQFALLVRAADEESAAAASQIVQQTLHAIDPLVAPFDIQTMEARRDYTQWPSRVFGGLFASFGVIALVLALTGIYGVMAYTVSRRRREIGVRMALGAAPLDIMRDVLRRASILAATGIVIGAAGAFAVTRLLSDMLYQVDPTDLRTFVAVPALLAATVLLASYIPARRAAKVDPMEALRMD